MSEKLSCHIVKDLLPLYADGLTSEESSRDIKEHLEGCEDCRAAFEAMTKGEEDAQLEQKQEDGKQIDYLKKVKRRGKRAAIIVGCAALAVLAVLGWRVFVQGRTDRSLMLSAQVQDGGEVQITAKTDSSSMAVSGIDITEKDGVLKVTARTCASWIRKNDSLTKTYTARSDIKQIVNETDGAVLWENGVAIAPYVGKVYANKTKYVGNASAVDALKWAIWQPATDMPYSGIELQTASEPYGMCISIGRDDIEQSDTNLEYLSSMVRAHSCLMLALVDNLGYVEYKIYTGRDIISGQEAVDSYRFTASQVLEYAKARARELPSDDEAAKAVLAAGSIKDFSKSASDLQMLVRTLYSTMLMIFQDNVM